MGQTHQSLVVRILKVIIPLVVVVASVVAGIVVYRTAPQAERRPRPRNAALVEVSVAVVKDAPVVVEAAGTVVPAQQVALGPRVRGNVVALSPELEPGGIVREGDELVRIDPSDYRLAVQQMEGSLAQVEANLNMEEGRQTVAKAEVRLLGEAHPEANHSLMTRDPQMRSAKGAVSMARAARARARADLSRTRVNAPFDAVVSKRSTELGAYVTEGTPLVTLVGTREWRVEVGVPVDELRWVRVPDGDEAGSTVRVFDDAAWGPGVSRVGRVVRLAPELEQQGRLARLLVAVDDPMCLQPENADKPRLLLGAFVRVEVDGDAIRDAVSLDRPLLRDGDRVWLLADGKLDIRNVVVAHRGPDSVVVEGLAAGDMVVTTDLGSAVQGMKLRTREDETAPVSEGDGALKPR